jgi:hypothetical protein
MIWTRQPWIRLKATEPLRVSFQTLWEEDYLYLYVDVEGSTLDSGGKIEVFVDQNNAKTLWDQTEVPVDSLSEKARDCDPTHRP